MKTTAKLELIKYDAARRALAEAHSVDEIKDIRDKAVALEAYARQAKDHEMADWCAEIRLRAERGAGRLLAEMKERGERADKGQPKVMSRATTLNDLGVTRSESSKWQKLAAIPEEKFERTIADHGNGFLRTAFSSKTDQWLTPPDIIVRVSAVMRGIDLDPCAEHAKAVPAKRHFTIEDDGLAQTWSGRVYMNPPYGDVIDSWVEKLLSEDGVTEAIALVPSRTDTHWFRRFYPTNAPVCFFDGRLKFSDSENSAPFPSAAFYLGPRGHSFAQHFGPVGSIFMPAFDWLFQGEDDDAVEH
jgi:hypothetical protein